jgi:dynein heavy chain
MKEINEKEELLGFTPTEFPKLEEAQRNLKPYKELWFLIKQKTNQLDYWKKTETVFNLEPEEIEKEVKAMV